MSKPARKSAKGPRDSSPLDAQRVTAISQSEMHGPAKEDPTLTAAAKRRRAPCQDRPTKIEQSRWPTIAQQQKMTFGN